MRRAATTAASVGPRATTPLLWLVRRSFFLRSRPTPNDDCLMFFSAGHNFLAAPGANSRGGAAGARSGGAKRLHRGTAASAPACDVAEGDEALTTKPDPVTSSSSLAGGGVSAPAEATTWAFGSSEKHLSPLAQRVFEVPGVVEVTVARDFVTVRRHNAEMDGDEDADDIEEEDASDALATDGSATGTGQKVEASPATTTTTNSVTPHGLTTKTLTVDPKVARKALGPPKDWHELKLPVMAAITDFVTSRLAALSLDAPHPNADTLPQDDDSEVVLMIKEHLSTNVRPVLHADGGDLRFVGFDPTDGVLRLELLGACRKCSSSATTLHDLIERSTRHWIPEVKSVEEVAAQRRAAAAEAEAGGQQQAAAAAKPGGGAVLHDGVSFAEATARINRTQA